MSRVARRLISVLAFAFVIHAFVIPQIVGARRSVDVVGSVSPWLVAAAVSLEAASLVAYAELTRRLLPTGTNLGLRVATGSVLASTAVNHVVPGGAATTAAVNYHLLGRAGIPRDQLGTALGVQAIGSAVVLNVMLWLALLAAIPATGFHPIYATAAAVGMVLIGAAGGITAAIVRGRDTVATHIAATLGRLPFVSATSVESALLNAAQSLRDLGEDRRRATIAVALAAANWLLDAAALWVMLTAFGHVAGPVGVLVAYGLANVLGALPISPGGLGIVEAVLIPTLVSFGAPHAEAAVAVVAYRLISYWLPIPIGAIAYAWVEWTTSNRSHRRGFRGELNARLS